MAETVIEVNAPRPQDLIEPIERLAGVRHAALFGRGLHVVAEDADRAIGEIMALAESPEVRAERIVPSLEDVFVSLIEARDRESAPQQVFTR